MVTQEQQFLPLHQLIPEIMHSLTYKIHNGHKILSLDGGWMRSLIQVEILEQLEVFTGQNVTEIFDTFIGSSSGALIILGLVYGEYNTIYILIMRKVISIYDIKCIVIVQIDCGYHKCSNYEKSNSI